MLCPPQTSLWQIQPTLRLSCRYHDGTSQSAGYVAAALLLAAYQQAGFNISGPGMASTIKYNLVASASRQPSLANSTLSGADAFFMHSFAECYNHEALLLFRNRPTHHLLRDWNGEGLTPACRGYLGCRSSNGSCSQPPTIIQTTSGNAITSKLSCLPLELVRPQCQAA